MRSRPQRTGPPGLMSYSTFAASICNPASPQGQLRAINDLNTMIDEADAGNFGIAQICEDLRCLGGIKALITVVSIFAHTDDKTLVESALLLLSNIVSSTVDMNAARTHRMLKSLNALLIIKPLLWHENLQLVLFTLAIMANLLDASCVESVDSGAVARMEELREGAYGSLVSSFSKQSLAAYSKAATEHAAQELIAQRKVAAAAAAEAAAAAAAAAEALAAKAEHTVQQLVMIMHVAADTASELSFLQSRAQLVQDRDRTLPELNEIRQELSGSHRSSHRSNHRRHVGRQASPAGAEPGVGGVATAGSLSQSRSRSRSQSRGESISLSISNLSQSRSSARGESITDPITVSPRARLVLPPRPPSMAYDTAAWGSDWAPVLPPPPAPRQHPAFTFTTPRSRRLGARGDGASQINQMSSLHVLHVLGGGLWHPGLPLPEAYGLLPDLRIAMRELSTPLALKARAVQARSARAEYELQQATSKCELQRCRR